MHADGLNILHGMRERPDTPTSEFKRMGTNDKTVKVSDPILRWIVGLGGTIGTSIGLWFAQQVQKDAVSVSVLNQRVSSIETQIQAQIRDLKQDFREGINELKAEIRKK